MLDMEDLNFMGGGFDEPSCDQYFNELAASNLHTSNCPTPWELPELCIECFAASASNSNQTPPSGSNEGRQHPSAMPSKTYAEVAASSPGHDVAQEPLIESMPARRPRVMSAGQAARLALHSQYREQWVPPPRKRQVWPVDDVLMDPTSPTPNIRHHGPTYAEVAQYSGGQDEFEGLGSYSLFTSTENSQGLPNQNICRVRDQRPYRTPRTHISHIAPYPIISDQRHLAHNVDIPTLIQPEHNLNPRDPHALVQRTGRGGHREPVTSNSSISGASSPMSCGPASTASAASRSRTKEVQDRPHPCRMPGCFWRFVNPKDLKRHEKTHDPDATSDFPCPHPFCVKSYKRGDNLNRHLRSEHAVDSGLGSSRSSSTYSGLALRRA